MFADEHCSGQAGTRFVIAVTSWRCAALQSMGVTLVSFITGIFDRSKLQKHTCAGEDERLSHSWQDDYARTPHRMLGRLHMSKDFALRAAAVISVCRACTHGFYLNN